MSRHFILDSDGNVVPTDVITWARWFEKKDVRIVAQTSVGSIFVSTVFLGLDHSFGREGPPVLWETCVFKSPDRSDHMRRYTSRIEAEQGHHETVEAMKQLFGNNYQ